uniref:Ovule protein n=1 Tax=Heterorhabditis bacteriophora TaxID=37862 RepID=A0A1I7W822_HETBA
MKKEANCCESVILKSSSISSYMSLRFLHINIIRYIQYHEVFHTSFILFLIKVGRSFDIQHIIM